MSFVNWLHDIQKKKRNFIPDGSRRLIWTYRENNSSWQYADSASFTSYNMYKDEIIFIRMFIMQIINSVPT